MTGLLVVVLAWRLARRLVTPVIVLAFSVLVLHSGSIAHHHARRVGRTAGRVVRPIERDPQRVSPKAVRR